MRASWGSGCGRCRRRGSAWCAAATTRPWTSAGPCGRCRRSRTLGGQAGEGPELPCRVAKRAGSPMAATRAGPPTSATPGRVRASRSGRPTGSRSPVGGVGGELGLDGAQQPDLGGDSAARSAKRPRGARRRARARPRRRRATGWARSAPWWLCEALAISAVSRLTPSLTRAFGSAQRSSTARSATPSHRSAASSAAAGGPGP